MAWMFVLKFSWMFYSAQSEISFHLCQDWSFIQFFLINLFIYFWLRWVFVAACRLSLVAMSRDYSSLQCTGFSLRWLLLLRSLGSRHVGFSSCGAWAQQLWLASSRAQAQQCGARAQLLRGMWDLPRPGIKPSSLALEDGFSTTGPPGSPDPLSLRLLLRATQSSYSCFFTVTQYSCVDVLEFIYPVVYW